jgi:hypothetical protein
MILVLVGGSFSIFLQMEWDTLTSLGLKTTPHQVSFNRTFLTTAALHILPLLGVLALASGDLSDLLHTIFDPLFKLIH